MSPSHPVLVQLIAVIKIEIGSTKLTVLSGSLGRKRHITDVTWNVFNRFRYYCISFKVLLLKCITNITFLAVEVFIITVLISDVSSVEYIFQILALICICNAHLALSGENLEGLYNLWHISKNLKGLPLNLKQIIGQR